MEPLAPDAIEIPRLFLLDQQPIRDLVSERIATELDSEFPAIRYGIVSPGSTTTAGEHAPLLQFECWGPLEDAADGKTAEQVTYLLARTLAAVLPGLRGEFTDGWAAVADVTDPFPSPDPLTNRPRWLRTARLHTYPS